MVEMITNVNGAVNSFVWGIPMLGAARRYGYSDDRPYQIFPVVTHWTLV